MTFELHFLIVVYYLLSKS